MSILSLILFAGMISAGVDFVNVTNDVVSVDRGNSVTITFQVEEDGSGNLTDITFNTPLTLDSNSHSLDSEENITDVITTLDQSTTSAEMTLTFDIPSDQSLGTYTGDLTLTGTYTSEVTYDLPISIEVTAPTLAWQNDFCLWDDGSSDNQGDLRIKIEDITVTGFGDDDEWLPLDEIEIEIEIQNRGTEDVADVVVEWGLYDTEEEDWVIEVDEEDEFDVDEDEEELLTFTFQIDDDMDMDLEDLTDGKHYVLYVRAVGEIDGGDYDGEDTCAFKEEEVELFIEKNFVVLSDIEYMDTVSCGTDLQITADVWNIGSKNQDDVEVKVYSNVLGISELFQIGDVDAFENEKLDVTITLPEEAEERSYLLYIEVYDEDGDVYENKYDDELSSYSLPIEISGGCSLADQEPKAIVSADLESGGKAGKPLVIRSTITNTGDETVTYMVNAAGYSEWATLSSIDQETITLTSGASGDVVFTFDVLEDAIGDNLFDIELVSDNQLVASQPVSVSIEKSGVDFSSVFGDSWYLWLIGLVNVILVIIIIIVAVRVARK